MVVAAAAETRVGFAPKRGRRVCPGERTDLEWLFKVEAGAGVQLIPERGEIESWPPIGRTRDPRHERSIKSRVAVETSNSLISINDAAGALIQWTIPLRTPEATLLS